MQQNIDYHLHSNLNFTHTKYSILQYLTMAILVLSWENELQSFAQLFPKSDPDILKGDLNKPNGQFCYRNWSKEI